MRLTLSLVLIAALALYGASFLQSAKSAPAKLAPAESAPAKSAPAESAPRAGSGRGACARRNEALAPRCTYGQDVVRAAGDRVPPRHRCPSERIGREGRSGMSDLVTLRGLSGLDPEPAPLGGSALVMVDLQNTYREGVMRLDGVEPALREAAALLARAREAGIPVLHIQHDAGPGSPYDVGAPIGRISDEVAPRAGEPVITKAYPSAFVGTDLQARLEAAGVKDVVLAGFMTHMCINSTARSAFSLGFRPTVVASATATRDLPAPDGSVVPAGQVQAASLAALADLFAVVAARQADSRG